MTSSPPPAEAYVWVWLPGRVEPVVAGLLRRHGTRLFFNYGRSYLARPDAIPLYAPELPLRQGELPLLPGLSMPGCIRDASPDAWGRRVIVNRLFGLRGAQAATIELDELTFLLESGSDRVGALDFQPSATLYQARLRQTATLDELAEGVHAVERGHPLAPALDQALRHGTSLGGARPKVLVDTDARLYIAKFSSSGDLYAMVKAEYVAMRLAAEVGLDVAPVRLTSALGKDVLLVERFDRERTEAGWTRKATVSALTMLELDEMLAAHASYQDLAEVIRHRFVAPAATLRELFGRIVFNVLCGNTDDHARNHAAFWDGARLALTPAYDICPQPRTGGEASQAMLIHGNDRMSRIATCLDGAHAFLLAPDAAKAVVAHQIAVIRNRWDAVCDEAALADADRRLLYGRQFLNPFAFYDAPADLDPAREGAVPA